MASLGHLPFGDKLTSFHTRYSWPSRLTCNGFGRRKFLSFGTSGFKFRFQKVDYGEMFVDFLANGEEVVERCGRGKAMRLRAVGGKFAMGEDDNSGADEPEDALRETIEKSKKVLAMQQDLLQQIAERRKLVSSIKNSIASTDEQTVSKESAKFSSDYDLPRSERELGFDHGNGAASETYALSTAFDAPKIEVLGFSGDNEVEEESVRSLTFGTASSEVDSIEKFEEGNQWDTLSTRIPDTSEVHVSTKEYVEEYVEAIEHGGLAADPGDEDAKPLPLAGVNVMNVILVAAECAPWSKTGGLGDVAGALPKALARRGHRVMVVTPRYGDYHEAQETGVRKRYKVDGQDNEVNYYQAYVDGVDFVFIDIPMFRHIGKDIYGGSRLDILKRMVLFCKAAVEVCWHVPCGGVCYGDGNLVFIANDWHTALLPVYLKAYYRDNGLMTFTRSVLVIHNIAHQGRGPMDDFNVTGLPEHYKDLFSLYDPVGGDHFNIFAAGLKSADRIVTVSHGYAWELKTSEGGWGLHNIINESDWKLSGIVNGIDMKEWNPEYDVHLTSDGYTNYSLETVKTGKAQCKEALQKEFRLPIRPDVPLIGFIGRLDGQKGVDIIGEAIPWIVGQDVQLVMLGTGRPDLEQMLKEFEAQHQDNVRGWVGFSVKTAHRITAGADILLMPSRFEPCGLNQLYAMMYGTIPVVHAVGGLRDTVKQFDPFTDSGLGWTFDRAETNKLINALGNCLLTYRQHKSSWEGLQQRGMTQDLSWDHAAQLYEEVLVAAKYQW